MKQEPQSRSRIAQLDELRKFLGGWVRDVTSITGLIALLSSLPIYGAFVWVWNVVGVEGRAAIFLASSSVLVLALVIVIVYALRQWRMKKSYQELVDQLKIEKQLWQDLFNAMGDIDDQLAGQVRALDGVKRDRRTREYRNETTATLLERCSGSALLGQQENDLKRVTLLSLDQLSDTFMIDGRVGRSTHRHANEKRTDLTRTNSLAGLSAQQGKTLRINDVGNQAEWAEQNLLWHTSKTNTYHCIACAPVRTGTECTDVLVLESSRPGAIKDPDVLVLEQFAKKVKLIRSTFPPDKDTAGRAKPRKDSPKSATQEQPVA